jgi:NADH-ubiquinone oxidoreductase chain 5
MYLSILALPLLSSIISGLLGRKIGVTGTHIITCTSLFLTSILAIFAFYEVGICGSPVSLDIMTWIDSEFLFISWGFLFDSLTVSMIIPISFISFLVHIYSISYMSGDPALCLGLTLQWVKLSNSGDFLKLIIPNYN